MRALTFLLIGSLIHAHAAPPFFVGGPILGVVAQAPGEEGPEVLFFLHAEETGTQSGWTNVGSVNWDSATAYAGTGNYGGTNSFMGNDSASARYTYTGFTNTTGITVTFAVRRNNPSATQRTVCWLSQDGTNRCLVAMATGGFRITNGSTNHTVGTASSIVANTWYGVSFSYANDGRYSLRWATNSYNFSTGFTGSWMDGTSTSPVNTVAFGYDTGLSGNTVNVDDAVGWMGYESVGDSPGPP